MGTQAFWTYIMGGAGRTIYIGVTNNLLRRVWEHKTKITPGFTAQYNLDKLLFYAEFNAPREAIAYEKKLKGWVRRKKDVLIEGINADRQDLAADWYPLQGILQSASLLQHDESFRCVLAFLCLFYFYGFC